MIRDLLLVLAGMNATWFFIEITDKKYGLASINAVIVMFVLLSVYTGGHR